MFPTKCYDLSSNKINYYCDNFKSFSDPLGQTSTIFRQYIKIPQIYKSTGSKNGKSYPVLNYI